MPPKRKSKKDGEEEPSVKKEVFVEEEEVLVKHKGQIYHAKVLQTRTGSDTPYFVHYRGWGRRWDEWIPVDRILKTTPENLQLKAELDKLKKKRKKGSRAPTEGEGGEEDDKDNKEGKRSRKSKKEEKEEDDEEKDEESEDEEETVEKTTKPKPVPKAKKAENDETENKDEKPKKLVIKLSGTLKKILVADWEQIAKQKKLAKLPRNPTATKIFNDFVESKKSKNPTTQSYTQEVVYGLKTYFDRALGRVLLYKFERPQYDEWVGEKKNMVMSDIYGAEHLLRLFVKLPDLIEVSKLDNEQIAILQTKLAELLKFLEKNKDDFFLTNYEPTDKEYHKKVE